VSREIGRIILEYVGAELSGVEIASAFKRHLDDYVILLHAP